MYDWTIQCLRDYYISICPPHYTRDTIIGVYLVSISYSINYTSKHV